MGKRLDIVGQRFGRLIALHAVGKKGGTYVWTCQCDCGKQVDVRVSSLRAKGRGTTSCGCARSHAGATNPAFVHGGAVGHGGPGHPLSPEYKSWAAMKQRCYNANSDDYKHYGAKGVIVCKRWLNSFANFFSDMGTRPEGHSLDRIDPTKGYTPKNCRWADVIMQAQNRVSSRWIEARGERKILAEWSRISGVSAKRISKRLDKGWEPERAIFEKPTRCVEKSHTTYEKNFDIRLHVRVTSFFTLEHIDQLRLVEVIQEACRFADNEFAVTTTLAVEGR